jgi:trehalose synthase
MSVAPPVPENQPRIDHVDDYIPLLGPQEIDQLHTLAAPLQRRNIQMVNSTAVGGGVAEILNRLVPLLKDLGLNIRWDVITGGNEFFEITKAFHNALQGGPYARRPQDFETFLAYNEQNRARIPWDAEFTVIHDPQPLALVNARQSHAGHWIWRCHIDLSQPNQEVWKFLEPYVLCYDGALFSSPEFTRQLPIPQFLFYPSIDPLADKNRPLAPEYVQSILDRYGIDAKRPILTQVSRFDRMKDPVGVVGAYRIVRKYFDCQLVLAGGGAADDPEGGVVLEEVRKAAGDDPNVHILNLPPWSALEINALQRASTIIIQKSLREGFGLTVTEALWKKKPVVASAVGGIPSQIIHKHTGLLAHSVEGAAYQIRYLLSNSELAAKLGEQGHQHVRDHFLITSSVKNYLTLFLHLDREK